jgi:hypothetical protein
MVLMTSSILVIGIYGLAQDKTADNMQAAREKLQADKKLFVTEHMKLTDSESKAFWPVYESYQKDMGAVNDRLANLVRDYASHYANMTNDEAKKLVDDSLAIDADRLKIRQSYLPKFRQVLSEIKVARYYQIENKIQAAVNYDLATGIRLTE